MDAHKGSQEVYSKKVKAGKRTYFFDVKATRANDYYLTITESKKQPGNDVNKYEKHKIFLYKEDLNKFLAALHNTTEHIKKELLPHYDFDKFSNEEGSEEFASPRDKYTASNRA
mgnify:CR=1 FL=1